VLGKHSPQSHTYVGDHRFKVDVDAPATKTVQSLEKFAQDYIKSLPKYKSWGDDVDDLCFVVHLNPINHGLTPPPPSTQSVKQRLVDMANSDQLNDATILAPTASLATIADPLELVFVFGTLFQSPSKQFSHLACRKLVVTSCIV
jgi:hypothetical protein